MCLLQLCPFNPGIPFLSLKAGDTLLSALKTNTIFRVTAKGQSQVSDYLKAPVKGMHHLTAPLGFVLFLPFLLHLRQVWSVDRRFLHHLHHLHHHRHLLQYLHHDPNNNSVVFAIYIIITIVINKITCAQWWSVRLLSFFSLLLSILSTLSTITVNSSSTFIISY